MEGRGAVLTWNDNYKSKYKMENGKCVNISFGLPAQHERDERDEEKRWKKRRNKK